MSQMNFDRRAQLSGKAVARTQFAAVRGNIRRAEADGISAVPYFKDLSIGDTLIVKLDGVTFTTTVTGVSLNQVIVDLNTEFGSSGVAFDSDGCIGIRTATVGGEGSVEVTGGTGAESLGFDTKFGEVFKALGGDIASSPEGRIENQFGSSLPLPRMNLTTDIVNNALGRMAGNIDVLFSDLMRGDVKLKKVNSFTIDSARTKITPPDSTRVYTGGTVGSPLTSSSPPEVLGAYFVLIDTVTKQQAPSRVTAVQYLGSNILGVDRAKTSNTITNIKNGRVVEVTGSITGVAVGDFATISSATNLSPWSNNGYRWIVEEILDSTHIALRPMSKVELAMVGSVVDDSQPILELNDKIFPSESFGTVNFSSGIASTDVDLIVSPAIPQGASYELWVAQPQSLRESRSDSAHDSINPLSRNLFSILDFLPNGLLSHPTITINAVDISWTAFYARRHGRVFLLPAASITRPASTDLDTFVYWEPASNTIKTTTSGSGIITGSAESLAPDESETSIDGIVLCSFLNDATASPTIEEADGLISDYTNPGRITVGWNGQFLNIQSAIGYLNSLSKASGEYVSQRGDGDISHHEVILLNSQTISSPVLIQSPGTIIRGANPEVRLNITGNPSSVFAIGSSVEFTLRDLTIINEASISDCDLIVDAPGITSLFRIKIQNIKTGGGTQPFRTLYRGSNSTTLNSLHIQDCQLILGGGISWGFVDEIFIYKSKFAYFPITGLETNQIFCASSTGPSLGIQLALNTLSLEDTEIIGWETQGDDGNPLLLDDNGSGQITINRCRITFGSGLATGVALMRAENAFVNILSSEIGSSSTAIYSIIATDSLRSSIDDCVIYVEADQEHDGVHCGRVDNTQIFAGGVDASTGFRYLHGVPTGSADFTEVAEMGEFDLPVTALHKAKSRMYRDRSGTLWITHNAKLNRSTNEWHADDTSIDAVAVRFGVGSNGRYVAPYSGGLPIPMATFLATYKPFITSDQSVTWSAIQTFSVRDTHDDGILVNAPATTNRPGVDSTGNGTGAAFKGTSSNTSGSKAFEGVGTGNNGAALFTGAGTGSGAKLVGGSSSGSGAIVIGGAPNGYGVDASNSGSGSAIFAEALGTGIGVEIDASGGTGKALDAIGNSSSDTASFAGGSGRKAATFIGGAGADAASFTGGSSTGKGIVASGGGTGVGGQFSNGTAATGSTPQNAVVLANGNLSLTGAEPDATVGFTDTLTPTNLVKAWAYIRTDGVGGVSLTDGFNIASVSISTQVLTVNLQTDMANLDYGVAFGGGSAQAGGAVVVPYERGNVRTAGSILLGAFTYNAGLSPGQVDFETARTDITVWVIGRQ